MPKQFGIVIGMQRKRRRRRFWMSLPRLQGLHRKAAIRLLNRANKPQVARRRGRPRRYSTEVVVALKTAWEAGDCLCSKRLHPFLPEMVRVLRENGESHMTVEVEAQLCRMSPSTIDRTLHPFRHDGGKLSFLTTGQEVYSKV